MTLADKIIKERKKNGWSQEELADKMNVSRQAVSKRESAQSFPDLDKIVQLSSLFNVTTDYLLKEEIDEDLSSENITSDSSINKYRKNIAESILLAYFGMITIGYFVWSFVSKDWHITWIVFIIGGVFLPLVNAVCEAYKK